MQRLRKGFGSVRKLTGNRRNCYAVHPPTVKGVRPKALCYTDDYNIGVCVLTNLNVSASTDSLCNGIIDIVKGRDGGRISNDVWTVFDIVFFAVTLLGIILFASVFWIRSKHILIFTAIVLALLLFTMIILFPVIFSAPLREILFIWAPASLVGGMIMICANIIHICIRLFLRKNNADRRNITWI